MFLHTVCGSLPLLFGDRCDAETLFAMTRVFAKVFFSEELD